MERNVRIVDITEVDEINKFSVGGSTMSDRPCPKDDCEGTMIEETISRREALVRRICLTCGLSVEKDYS